ncbi:hypothetical protein FJ366_03540 [Candidatus Dependentiae bacterium]|nr:hypothetical protein [Candidatus Dependentiae bacterium]
MLKKNLFVFLFFCSLCNTFARISYYQEENTSATSTILTLTKEEEVLWKKEPCSGELEKSTAPSILKLKKLLQEKTPADLQFLLSSTNEIITLSFIPTQEGNPILNIKGPWKTCPKWLTTTLSSTADLFEKKPTLGLFSKIGLTLTSAYALSRWHISKSTGEKELELSSEFKIYDTVKKTDYFLLLFIHGYLGHNKNTIDYISEMFEHLYSEIFNNHTYFLYSPAMKTSRRYASFAQRWDQAQALQQLKAMIELKKKHNKPFIVMGSSNGASTLLSIICQNKDIAREVDAVILAAPFADIGKISVEKFFPPAKYFPHSDTATKRIIQATIAPNYSCSEPSPLELASSCEPSNPSLPIIFLTATDDEMIPWQHTELLSNALKGSGFSNVHPLFVDQGGHNIQIKLGSFVQSYTDGSSSKPFDEQHNAAASKIRQIITDVINRHKSKDVVSENI